MSYYVKDIYFGKLLALVDMKMPVGRALLRSMVPTKFATKADAMEAIAQSVDYGKVAGLETFQANVYEIVEEGATFGRT